jgi:VanZ family protein
MTEQADNLAAAVGPPPGMPRRDPGPILPFIQRLFSLATAAYVGVLVYATHHPRPQELIGEGPDVPSDKSLHVMAYFVLGLLSSATLAAWRRWTLGDVVALAVGLLVFGAADEATQPLFGRFADVADWFADCRGVLAGILAVAAILAASAPRTSPRQ